MSTLTLYSKLEMLPDNLKKEASDFIDFLLEKSGAKSKTIVPRPGSARGKIRMSPDFDAPIDDFKDYM
jgi:hypothetical protein